MGVIIAVLVIILTAVIAFVVVKKGSDDNDNKIRKPGPPNNLERDDALTDQTQVSFSWNAPEDDGGESVSDY